MYLIDSLNKQAGITFELQFPATKIRQIAVHVDTFVVSQSSGFLGFLRDVTWVVT